MKLPDYNLYWAAETRYPKIADVMSNKRINKLRKFFHVVDNTTKDKPGNQNDKAFKIRPVIEAVRENSRAIEAEPFLQKQNEVESVNITQRIPRNGDSKCLSVQVEAG